MLGSVRGRSVDGRGKGDECGSDQAKINTSQQSPAQSVARRHMPKSSIHL